MSGAIRVEKIRYVEIRSEHTEMRGMIKLDQIGVKASGEKRGRSEQSKNITEREKSRAKKRKEK